MRLILAGDLASADPVIPVRWCGLTRDETDMLRRRRVATEHVHILLVILYEGGGLEDRYLVPLDQMMTYLNFRRPGAHKVFGKVVWCGYNKDHIAKLKSFLLEKHSQSKYVHNVLTHEKTGFNYNVQDHSPVSGLDGDFQLDVIVPKEHFPPEPPAWLKSLVNSGYDYPAIDQCQFRRRKWALPVTLPVRALVALFMFLVVSPVIVLVRTCTATALTTWGQRNVAWSPILHPMRDTTEAVYTNVRSWNNWFRSTKSGKKRSPAFLTMHPSIYVVLGGVAWVIRTIEGVPFAEASHRVGNLYVAVLGLFLVFLLGEVATGRVGSYFRRRRLVAEQSAPPITPEVLAQREQEEEAAREARIRAKREREEAPYNRLYETLACQSGITASVSSLPAERQTLRLRFLDLKARICRPYAAS